MIVGHSLNYFRPNMDTALNNIDSNSETVITYSTLFLPDHMQEKVSHSASLSSTPP